MTQTPPGNSGDTSLRRRRHRADPMRAYDNLPRELRRWLASAVLPWGAKSARRAYDRALARTGTPQLALRELDALQQRLVTRDAHQVWGPGHPGCPPARAGHRAS
ncbi:MAG: DUF6525 family protein [Marinovum algicola]|jgi:hypothetical protein|uniref:Uncharacterized protein n=3 Tax=Marinovum algicola TaxID=42444 RepID=A0A975WE77_9RHOB|nr:DUF6525 family protein [Marinovum algicola]SEK06034.1 hypothetical protein SAMN04487940_12262 [Marinovum algicola]SLN72669.1 hypothetical protein MAA5396_04077 [Marinovum algicola]